MSSWKKSHYGSAAVSKSLLSYFSQTTNGCERESGVANVV